MAADMRRSPGWLLLLICWPGTAAGGEPPLQEKAALRWLRTDSAASCPSEADVTQAIEQRLGRAALVSKEEASLVVKVELEGLRAGGYRIEIELLRGEELVGKRELLSEGDSCLSVAETAALVIALAIDPEASVGSIPIEPTAAPRVEPPPPTAPPAPKLPPPTALSEREPRTTAPWQGELELGGGIASGNVPGVAGGAHVRGRALPPELPFAVELEAAYFPARRLEALPNKGADFAVFYAGAGLCNRASRSSRLSALVCAGAEVGTVAGQGYGFDLTPRFQTWTFALAARAALRFRLRPPLAVVAGPTLTIPLKRDHFETKTGGGNEELFRLAKVGLGFGLGVVWEL
jgi:hypothetical protein